MTEKFKKGCDNFVPPRLSVELGPLSCYMCTAVAGGRGGEGRRGSLVYQLMKNSY